MKVLVVQSCLTLWYPMDCSPSGSSVHGVLQAGILEWIAISSSRESSNQGLELRSPVLQADALLAEPPGMPNKVSSLVEDHYDRPLNSPGQNCGVGGLSLLQGIFPTQGSSPGLPHCRWIIYHLSH